MKKLLLILLCLPIMGFGQDDDIVKIIDTLNIESVPEFPGGDEALMKFIEKEINYPEICIKEQITGKVWISFIVDTSGFVTNIKIVRGVNEYLDTEAIRVIKSLPNFNPAKKNGETVNEIMTIPITFSMQKKWWKRLWINDDRYYYKK